MQFHVKLSGILFIISLKINHFCHGTYSIKPFAPALPDVLRDDHIVQTELNRREDRNKARIGQKYSVSFNIVIIKSINVITIQYGYIGFKVL